MTTDNVLQFPSLSKATGADPIFAAIEAHREACINFSRCVGLESSLRSGDPAKPAAEIAVGESSDEKFDLALALLKIRPSTPAGAGALLGHVSAAEEPLLTCEEDWRFPDFDESGKPYHLTMMKHIANALDLIGSMLANSHREPIPARIKAHRQGRQRLISQNEKLRAQRRDVWKKAESRTYFFTNQLRWIEALYVAQRDGIEEALKFQKVVALDGEIRHSAIRDLRAAEVEQLLTPAPDLASVKWKRSKRHLAHLPLGCTPETIERVIGQDMAFLEAHPARQPCKTRH